MGHIILITVLLHPQQNIPKGLFLLRPGLHRGQPCGKKRRNLPLFLLAFKHADNSCGIHGSLFQILKHSLRCSPVKIHRKIPGRDIFFHMPVQLRFLGQPSQQHPLLYWCKRIYFGNSVTHVFLSPCLKLASYIICISLLFCLLHFPGTSGHPYSDNDYYNHPVFP